MEGIAQGLRNVVQELVKRQKRQQGQDPGGNPSQYTGGFGEVRRWQQGKPSGQDPEQFDAVEKIMEHPVLVKKQ